MRKTIMAAGILVAAGFTGLQQMDVQAAEPEEYVQDLQQTPDNEESDGLAEPVVDERETEGTETPVDTGVQEGQQVSMTFMKAAPVQAPVEQVKAPVITNGWNADKTMFYSNGVATTGQKEIDGNWYLFDSNGNKLTGKQYLSAAVEKNGAKTCWYDNSGKMLYGQQYLEKNWYCFDLFSGAMFTGERYLSTAYQPNGAKTVYYNAEGKMQYGFVNGKYYDTVTGARQANKLVTDNGKKYYITAAGTKHKGELFLNGRWKYFNEDGVMQTKFVTLKKGVNGFQQATKTVYYDQNGNMVYGQQAIDGSWYCFHKNTGAMFTGLTNLDRSYQPNGAKTVLYGQDGKMRYGEQVVNKNNVYFDTVTGAMLKNGYRNNKYYDNNGYMVRGERLINGKWKYFDEDGNMKTGFVTLEKGKNGITNPTKTVYYNKNGEMLYKQQYINGYWYCFDKVTGAMFTGERYLDTSYQYDGAKTVRYDAKGHMVYGVYQEGNKVFSYHVNTGAKQAYTVRTETINGKTGKVYYNASGNRDTGQKFINGKWYFFNPDADGFMAIGLTKIDKKYEPAGTKTVFYNNDGTMFYGQKQIENKWRYFKPVTGAMAVNELVLIPKEYERAGAKTCYYDKDGNMLYGIQIINGVKMEFDKVTGALIGDTKRLVDELAAYINANKLAGEVWSVAVSLLNGTLPGIYNNQSQQSASLMKLFVMGTVYDNYDWMCNSYGKSRVDGHLWNMITVSDNNAWKTLVTWLGGSYAKGTEVVTTWSHNHGYNDTRTINQSYGNWTSVKDTMNIVKDIANGRFKHSASMQNLLNNQQRKNKLPSGLPAGIRSGNKTGELGGTENDVAIVYAPKGTYVISVMSTALKGNAHAQGMIKEISRRAYNFLNA